MAQGKFEKLALAKLAEYEIKAFWLDGAGFCLVSSHGYVWECNQHNYDSAEDMFEALYTALPTDKVCPGFERVDCEETAEMMVENAVFEIAEK